MEMPDKDVLWIDEDYIAHFNDGSFGFRQDYYHSRILKAKDAEITSLHLEIDDCHKRLNRWADAHNELIGEVELRKEIAELKAQLKLADTALNAADAVIPYTGQLNNMARVEIEKYQKAREHDTP